MGSPPLPSDLSATASYVDWDDLAGLDRIVRLYQVGPNTVVAETSEGRDVRITACFDRGTGKYVADFERRTKVNVGGQQLRVWAQTPVYTNCASDDLTGCLEAAILEVDRLVVY